MEDRYKNRLFMAEGTFVRANGYPEDNNGVLEIAHPDAAGIYN